MNFLEFASQLFGWAYFLCWSLSFYPQGLLNFGRKSTSGTTADFPLINTLGFLAFTLSNAAFFWSPLVRAQYAARHKGLSPTVQLNDVGFAAHALILSFIVTSQYCFPGAWGFSPSAGNRPSRTIISIFFGCIVGVVVIFFVVLASPERERTEPAAAGAWMWLDVVYALSYVKLLITVVKYTPQVIFNYKNRSTTGWSIVQILLDFVGGVLSIAQLLIDSYMQRDWSGVTGNPVKLALGNVSIFYDVIFLSQHYIFYPDGGYKADDMERNSLLRIVDSGGNRRPD